MLKILIIGLGGFVGAVARYLAGRFLNPLFEHFPLGTMFVNILGSFFLAFLLYRVNFGHLMGDDEKDFWVIGVLGAFTTMSTFSYETFRLFELKHFIPSLGYFIFTLVGCFIAVYLGRKLAL